MGKSRSKLGSFFRVYTFKPLTASELEEVRIIVVFKALGFGVVFYAAIKN